MSEWQPIGTAPRDGTEFLAYWQFGSSEIMRFTQVMKWNEYRNKFIITWDHDDEAEPTHWMPLPSPPENQP